MNRIRALAHRVRWGHWRQPWDIDFDMGGDPAPGCRRCVLDAIMADIRSEGTIGGNRWPS